MRGRGGTPPGEEDKTFVGNLLSSSSTSSSRALWPLTANNPLQCPLRTDDSPQQSNWLRDKKYFQEWENFKRRYNTNVYKPLPEIKLCILKNGVHTNLVKQHQNADKNNLIDLLLVTQRERERES